MLKNREQEKLIGSMAFLLTVIFYTFMPMPYARGLLKTKPLREP